jgi:hypothetical protein
MRAIRCLSLVLVLPLAASAAPAEDADDWRLFGGMLTLMQQLVQLAAHSPDPQAAQKGVDAMLSGANPEANRIASGVMAEILRDVPEEHRGAFAGIGRDLVTLARREQARVAAMPPAPSSSREEALRARKELHAMGLRYWDEEQFLAAARRGDRLAVELFVAAQGLGRGPGDPARNLPPAR